MKIMQFLSLLVLSAASSSFAAELDTYYLKQFGELPETGKYSLKSAEAETVHKCGMPLRHNLQRDWGKLEPSTQKILASYITPPQLTNAKTFTSSSGRFNITYATSGTDTPTPAYPYTLASWVEKVAAIFEEVYFKEVITMGYPAPPLSPYTVYLVQKPTDDYGNITFGMTISLTLNNQSAKSFIVIDNDFVESSYQATIPGNGTVGSKALNALQITAAHEFHHAIQFGINYYFEPWYAEATSSWMEDEVYDSVNQLYSYANDYLTSTATALNAGSGYSRWIFNRSIFEQFYPQDIIWKIWDDFAAEPASPGADIPMLPFIDKVLKSQGSSLAASFFGFAKKTYLNNWSSHTDEIANFHVVASTPFAADSVHTVKNPNLPAYSFTYYRVSPSTNSPSTLTLNYPDKPAEYQVVAFKNSDKTEYYYNESTQAVTIPDVGSNDTIYLLICNNSTTTTLPELPVNTGGSGGGGCFIATAAYGSYLHPEVMTLRDFRDRYLLTNLPGKVLVDIYYRTSPPLADFISAHESVKVMVRILLTPLIFAVKHLWAAAATATTLALIAFVRGLKLLRKKPNTSHPVSEEIY